MRYINRLFTYLLTYTGTTRGLRHGSQFGVPVRELVSRDSVRGDAWRCGSGEI